MATIIADTREENGATPFLPLYIEHNNDKNKKLAPKSGGGEIKFLKQQLEVGDYIILVPSASDPDRNIIGIVIERKTWKDLSASMKTDRMREQQAKLESIKSEKLCNVYFIIEGVIGYEENHDVKGIPFKNLHAKLRHNLLRDLPYIQTKNQSGTALLLVNLARDLMKMRASGGITFPDDFSEEEKIEIRSYMNRIDEIKNKYRHYEPVEGSGNIPKSLTTRKAKTSNDIIINMWTSLPGVSEQTALILVDRYKISDIICANSEKISLIEEEISEIKYPSGNRIGQARAKKILSINTQSSKKVSISLLSKIPGVSVVVAELILDKYSLKDLCTNKVTEEELSEIQRESGKRIGMKLSKKIIDILNGIVD
jgi:ERCC4-type nuclease